MQTTYRQIKSLNPRLRIDRRCRRCASRHEPRIPNTIVRSSTQSATLSPLQQIQHEQTQALERVIDGLGIDSLASLAFHAPDDIRGLVASEPVRSAALVTVPIGSTLAVALDDNTGELTVLAPPAMPPNVKKAIELVAGLIRETPDRQLLILAVLLLWVRRYGGAAWQEYCEALLPPGRELSCLLSYNPAELTMLQLPHMTEEASRQHDWARWAHTQWTSSASGALRRLGLADDLTDTAWALSAVRSRAVEFPVGTVATLPPSLPASSSASVSRGDGAGPTVTLLAPVIDLANHSPDPNCVVQLATDRSRVILLPRRQIPAGEPLTVDYGYDRTSLELMVDYGFVLAGNPHDGEVPLPGADKLPPLDVGRLQAAARALGRKRQLERLTQRNPGGRQQGSGRGQGEATEEADEEEEEEEDEHGALALAVGDEEEEAEEEAAEEACFNDRVKAALRLLYPRTGVLVPDARGFNSPATQRILAGLWHKLVQHTADSLPTKLEQDRQLLYDIEAGRVSGFGGGMLLTLDPAPMPVPTPLAQQDAAAAEAASVEATAAMEAGSAPAGAAATARRQAAAAAEEEDDAAGSRGLEADGRAQGDDGADEALLGTGRRADGAEGGGSETDESVGAGPAAEEAGPSASPSVGGGTAAAGSAGNGASGGVTAEEGASAGTGVAAVEEQGALPTGLCRSGRRAGRLYAAVRARIEYKEVLRVAEDILMEYGLS